MGHIIHSINHNNYTGGNMKKIMILMLVAGLFCSVNLFAQTSAKVVWVLADTTLADTVVGNVTAAPMTVHGTLTIHDWSGGTYSGPAPKINNGNVGWGEETWYVDSRYIQFMVSPQSGNSFHVDSVAFWAGAYGTHGGIHMADYWDIDTSFNQKHLVDLDSSSVGMPDVRDEANGPVHDTSFAINTKINDGGSFYFRVYPWYSASQSTSKYILLWLVRVYGTTSPATGIEGTQTLPSKFALNQNYPNPFNPTTRISFSLAKSSFTTLDVYNILGQKVASLIAKNMTRGYHEVNFNASSLTSGVYFYKLTSGSQSITKKLVLMK